MLTSVDIKAFRSCRDVHLDNLGPVTALIGRNAVGKSNVLKAIEHTARIATSTSTAATSPFLVHDVTFGLELGQHFYQYSVAILADRSDARPNPGHLVESLHMRPIEDAELVTVFTRHADVITLHGFEPALISAQPLTSTMGILQAVLPPDHPLHSLIGPLVAHLAAIRYYPFDEPSESDESLFIPTAAYESWLTKYTGTGDPGTSVTMRLVHLAKTLPKRFEEVQILLGDNGMGLIHEMTFRELDTPSGNSKADPARRLLFLSFDVGDAARSNRVYYDGLSLGTRRLLNIIVSLVFDSSSVMLIEHPEDGIHRGLLRKLVDQLLGYSDESQLIFASHSPVVLDMVTPESIRMVTISGNTTSVRSLTEDEVSAACDYLEEDGPLSDYLESIE